LKNNDVVIDPYPIIILSMSGGDKSNILSQLFADKLKKKVGNNTTTNTTKKEGEEEVKEVKKKNFAELFASGLKGKVIEKKNEEETKKSIIVKEKLYTSNILIGDIVSIYLDEEVDHGFFYLEGFFFIFNKIV
jgi:hypothetical protein